MNENLIAVAKDNMVRISPTKLSILVNSIVNMKVRSAINQIIVDMKNDGTLASLQEKWFGQSFVDLLPNEAPTW